MRPADRARRVMATRRQRGVAIVTALLMTTLAVTIVASLFWQQQVQVRSIENQRLQLQKEWILRGALDWARLILREDAKYSTTDTLDEPWAVPLSDTRLGQYVEEGQQAEADAAEASLSGDITDAQSRYNLTDLAPSGTVVPAEVAVFERLLTSIRIDPGLAQATAAMIAASSLQKAPSAGGQTSGQTSGGQTATTAQSLPLTQVDDLLAVPGFTPDIVERLRDYVIFLPRATTVNVNTAPPEVLAARLPALSLSEATALVASRKSASFRSLADFTQRLAGNGKSVSAAPNEISVATDYFIVHGDVKMRRAGLQVEALVERFGASTRLVWVREY